MADKKKKLKLTRRDFIKASVATGAGSSLINMMNAEVAGAAWYNEAVDNSYAVNSTCTYCSVGCGINIGTASGTTVVDIKGDTTNPINKGALCTKGQALVQLVNSTERLGLGTTKTVGDVYTDPKAFNCPVRLITIDDVADYNANQAKWKGVSWDDALAAIAGKMKDARGTTFDSDHQLTAAAKKKVAFFGSSHMNNEENYIYRKLIANFGTNNTEHQARI